MPNHVVTPHVLGDDPITLKLQNPKFRGQPVTFLGNPTWGVMTPNIIGVELFNENKHAKLTFKQVGAYRLSVFFRSKDAAGNILVSDTIVIEGNVLNPLSAEIEED